MYPSGQWQGYWEQSGFGRQPMAAFDLHFCDGVVTGRGVDVVGPFRFTGRYDGRTGRLQLTKQYLGKHRVEYDGQPDGEGCIGGTWRIGSEWSGPFQLRPVLPRATGSEPIRDIG